MVQCIFKHIVKYPMKFVFEIQSEYGYILFVSFYPCAFATLWIVSDVCGWLWMNRWLTPNSRKQWQEACDLSNLYVEHEEIRMSISFSPEQIKYVLLLGLSVYSKRTTDLKPNQAQQSTANKCMNGIDFLMSILTFITPKAIITIRYAVQCYRSIRNHVYAIFSALFRVTAATSIQLRSSAHKRFSFPAGLTLTFSDFKEQSIQRIHISYTHKSFPFALTLNLCRLKCCPINIHFTLTQSDILISSKQSIKLE